MVIEKNIVMILNTSTAVIKHLRIYGTLEFDEQVDDLSLNAKVIEIIEKRQAQNWKSYTVK